MSNKASNLINPLDRLIRTTLKLGMDSGMFLRIEYIHGFELFNTRAYHNYETWSGGYRVIDEQAGIVVESEDLDDALLLWAKQRECEHDFSPLIEGGKMAYSCKLCNKRNPGWGKDVTAEALR